MAMRVEPPEPHPIAAASTSVTAFVGRTRRGPLDRPVQVNSMAEFGTVFGGLWNDSALSFAVQHFFVNGGHTAIVARVASPEASETTPGGQIGDADLVPDEGTPGRRGIYLLEWQPNFDLLVIPPFAWDRDPSPSTWRAAAAYCRDRRVFLLIDPPAGSAVGTIDASGVGLTALVLSLPQASPAAQNAAYCYPRLVANNALTRQTQPFPPAGAIAGMMARMDTVAGVWTAPAGSDATILGATGLERDLSPGERSTLTSLGVNVLRALPSDGLVAWSARTLQGADGLSTDWKYLPVRRFALFLEKSVEEGTRWATFEPIGEPLWARIRLDVGEFLHALFQRGAFQGQTPSEAYFVRCGADTVTQQDIEQGIVNIQIGFAPLRPAEFVILSIRQIAAQPSWER
jgi:phage tail sheath protein FI